MNKTLIGWARKTPIAAGAGRLPRTDFSGPRHLPGRGFQFSRHAGDLHSWLKSLAAAFNASQVAMMEIIKISR